MSAMILACIAVLVVAVLVLLRDPPQGGPQSQRQAGRQFEVSIEVASESGSHHGRLSSGLGDNRRSLGQPDDQTWADRRARSNQPIAIPARSPGHLSSRASRRSDRRADRPGTVLRTDKSGSS